ncbi:MULTISPECIES: SDR family oxidoreductase [unclassified Gordonia (in: high G+C Gram-positive bacteria)]|uniref:SDR family oxidoreductase n=1 Tax=unclassified Gordonia (in: high G+C Gram-positive bacteria) TaxID=2657482 RepID=UPI0010F447B2|nr:MULTISPECIES: SDR family oxidoreductase [unclassified Gordonia (in: high G+C Gram-positive bacteria)]
MTTAVTGATGQLGGLVIDELLARGVAAADVVAIVRDESKASTLVSHGVSVRVADYDDPASLVDALVGVDKLLLVSGSAVGQRVAQHTNVIEAAEANSVELIAYTSLLHADTSGLSLAPEHVATEARLNESSVPAVILRNGWYWENYLAAIPQAAATGTLLGAAGEGKLAAAARADYAAAAAAVLTADTDQAGKVYELGGDERLTYGEFARAIGEASGASVQYRDLSEADYQAALVSAGLPEPVAAMLAGADAGISRGELDTDSGDLQSLIGRSSTPVAEVIAQALA